MSGAENVQRVAWLRRFKPYPAYKVSGVAWLGAIPAHWEVRRLKRIVQFRGGGTPRKENLEYWRGDIPWVSPKDMKVSVVFDTEDKITRQAVRESATKLVPAGAVLLVVRSGILVHSIPVALAGREVTLNQDLKALIPSSGLVSQYLVYLLSGLQRELLIEWKKEGATVESLELELVANTRIPLPGYFEQRAIVAFLDRETARIDTFLAKKERLIELLREKRTALITRAVTKALDPSAPMKDFGVEWLDQYPTHWTGLPLKRWVAVNITDGPHETPELVTQGVDFISAEAVSNGRIDFDKRRGFISPELHSYYCRKCNPVRDDILLCKSGATTGKLARVDVDFEFSVWSPLAVVRSRRSRILPRFLEMALGSEYVQKQIRRTWSAGT